MEKQLKKKKEISIFNYHVRSAKTLEYICMYAKIRISY